MITINFSNDRFTDRDAKRRAIVISSIILVISAIFAFQLYVIFKAKAEVAERSKSVLSDSVRSLRETLGDAVELEVLREKLQKQLLMVAQLRRGKRGPVRILDDVSNALPDRAWIGEIAQKGTKIKITGRALDNQTISEFMLRLDASNWLQSVDLDESRQEIIDGVKVQAFTLESEIVSVGKHFGSSDPSESLKP
jgi:type IV pilus assembly protein PilN